MRPNERREAIRDALFQRRHDTYENLAHEFGGGKRTIQNDIKELMLSYPIKTVCGRYGGGVMLEEWFNPHRKTLTTKQAELLKRLGPQLEGEDRETLISILTQFAP